MAKINFCGDSFCRKASAEGWPRILATALNAEIVGLGKSGSAVEHAIRSFDTQADYTVFCWTEPHRLYHPDYPISFARAEAEQNINLVYKAAYEYYKYLHDTDLTEKRYVRDLYWFDTQCLNEYEGKAIHLFCFECLYEFSNGVTFFHPLNLRRDVPFAMNNSAEVANHLTVEQNKQLADELYECLKP